MTTFRALVVDDDDWVRKKGGDASDVERGIEVLLAKNKEEAAELIAENFLHLAVVDLELRRDARRLGEGRTVLRGLLQARPSCRRILLTQHATEFPEGVFELTKPDSPVVYGAINKGDLDEYFHRYVRAFAEDWQRAPVEITNLEEIFELISAKQVTGEAVLGREVAVTADELRYVLASLFGQRLRDVMEPADPDDVERIQLTPFFGGKSRSIVLHGRPVNRLGGEGLLCVVKVGPREDAQQELRRYEQYVRFQMSLQRRVELLGQSIGDTLGAIAYSFAAEDPAEVRDLQTLLNGADRNAFVHFDRLYGEAGNWGAEGEEGDDLGSFFHEAYALKPHAVRERISDFADDQADAHGWQHRRDELRVKGGKLVLPTAEAIGGGLLHMDYRTAVVHGDLNASNVILGDAERSILIDYRHTTRGPRALDYASMHASIRLSDPARKQSIDSVAADEAHEYSLWQHDWGDREGWWPPGASGEPPYWLTAAATLMGVTGQRLPDLSRAEHAATCWLYALRVFRVRALDKDARLRILIWLSALQRVLAEESKQPLEDGDG